MARTDRSYDTLHADILGDEADGQLASIVRSLHRDLTSVYVRQPPTGLIEHVLSSDRASGIGTLRTSPSWSHGIGSSIRGRVARRPATIALGVIAAMGLAAGVGYAMHQFASPSPVKPQIIMNADGTPRSIVPAPESTVYYPSFVPPGMAERFAGEIDSPPAVNSARGEWGMRIYCEPASQSPISQRETGMCGLAVGFRGGPFQPVHIRLDRLGDPGFAGQFLQAVTPQSAPGPIVVWAAMHALPPGTRYLEIAEWRAGTNPYRLQGTRTTIAGVPATLATAHHHLSVMLTRGQTNILIRTNVSRRQLFRAVASLAPIDVAPVAPSSTS